jgi:hypothetical protein
VCVSRERSRVGKSYVCPKCNVTLRFVRSNTCTPNSDTNTHWEKWIMQLVSTILIMY